MAAHYVLTVMSLDRVGIVADMTGAILDLGGNIDSISQTVMRGYFTIIVTVHFDRDMPREALRETVRNSGAEGELEVSVKERTVLEPGPVVRDGDRFVLTIMGPDRKGIIKRITSYLSSRGINIDDLYAYVEGEEFLLIGELLVPSSVDIDQVKMDIDGILGEMQMAVTLQHENIFIATNQVDFRHTTR